jgi:6-phosphogluconolactonase (cycloisomerase 2 family)
VPAVSGQGRHLAPAGVLALLVSLACVAGLALAATGQLTFLEAPTQGVDGVDGIASASDVAVSSDGKNVYAIGRVDSGLATFKRQASGRLTWVDAKFEGVDGVTGIETPQAMALSQDGRSVYVSSPDDQAIALFKRSAQSGKLTFVEAYVEGAEGISGMGDAYGVVVSPDNKNVYVSNDANPGGVVTFKRNRQSGKLTFVNSKLGGGKLGDAVAVNTSADGHQVYLVSQGAGAITTFKRKQDGKLRQVDSEVDGRHGVTGMAGAYEPVVSGDGRSVYVPTTDADTIVTFKRNKRTGKLNFVNHRPVAESYDAVVSGDGKNVYAAAYNGSGASSLDVFKRDRSNGKLTFKTSLVDGVDGVEVNGVWRVAISPDDSNVYTADYSASSVGVFKRSK